MRQHKRTIGQALVEFALTATIIFLLLAAVVDLGLVFFTLQAMHNAAQEGATYGSRHLVTDSNGATTLDEAKIRERVRYEGGDKGIGFANLLDLNNSAVDDRNETDSETGKPVTRAYIEVMALDDVDHNGDPLNDGAAPNYTPCTNLTSPTKACYVRVVVHYNYKFIFPLAPAFGDQIRLRSSYLVPLRSGFNQGGAPTISPVSVTVTPRP